MFLSQRQNLGNLPPLLMLIQPILTLNPPEVRHRELIPMITNRTSPNNNNNNKNKNPPKSVHIDGHPKKFQQLSILLPILTTHITARGNARLRLMTRVILLVGINLQWCQKVAHCHKSAVRVLRSIVWISTMAMTTLETTRCIITPHFQWIITKILAFIINNNNNLPGMMSFVLVLVLVPTATQVHGLEVNIQVTPTRSKTWQSPGIESGDETSVFHYLEVLRSSCATPVLRFWTCLATFCPW